MQLLLLLLILRHGGGQGAAGGGGGGAIGGRIGDDHHRLIWQRDAGNCSSRNSLSLSGSFSPSSRRPSSSLLDGGHALEADRQTGRDGAGHGVADLYGRLSVRLQLKGVLH